MALKSLDPVVEELSRLHAEDQETIANNLYVSLWPLWHIMDFERLDETYVLWATAVTPVIQTAYLQSQRVAAAYEANVRFATLPTADPMPLIAPDVELPQGIPSDRFSLPDFGPFRRGDAVTFDPPELDDVRTSLLIEGVINIKTQMPVDEEPAMEAALVRSSGAAVRQSLKGARNVTSNVIKRDRRVLGYARYTDSNPCHFCGLLASRGAVYSRTSFVDSDPRFTANEHAADVPHDFLDVSKVHNNCKCTLRPVYSKSQAMDSDAKFYKDQWLKADGDVQKWRDDYTPYVREPADVVDLRERLRDRESSLLDAGFDPMSPQVLWAQRTQSLLA